MLWRTNFKILLSISHINVRFMYENDGVCALFFVLFYISKKSKKMDRTQKKKEGEEERKRNVTEKLKLNRK